MTTADQLLLRVLNAYYTAAPLSLSAPIVPSEWNALIEAARRQHVLPLVAEVFSEAPETLLSVPAAESVPKGDTGVPEPANSLQTVREAAFRLVYLQTVRSCAFLSAYRSLASQGIRPAVVKGIVLRLLCPQPDHRISTDEDLFLPDPAEYRACIDALPALGFRLISTDGDSSAEASFLDPAHGLKLEVHRRLFPDTLINGCDLNAPFSAPSFRTLTAPDGTELVTLDHTEHLLFLLLHAMKHFIYSGFGIRQLCDICVYVNAFGAEINWERIFRLSAGVKAEIFTEALLSAGESALFLRPDLVLTETLRNRTHADFSPLLEDMMAGGVYGSADPNRLHSSRFTLKTAAGQPGAGLWASIFPPRSSLTASFPCLVKYPWLLPAAWSVRIARYGVSVLKSGKQVSAAESIRIGKKRSALLAQYGITR